MNETDRDTLRVLVVDDHHLVRTAIAQIIDEEPGIDVIGTAEDAEAAISEVAAKDPQLVLLDIDMPGLDVFDAAATMKKQHPELKIAFLSAYNQDTFIQRALGVGCEGYISKAESPRGIVDALLSIAAGGQHFSPEVADRIVVGNSGPRVKRKTTTRLDILSQREGEVLTYLAKGLSKKEIAKQMGISVKTIDGHTTMIMTKLDIHDRVELSRFAVREGLINP